MTRQWNPNIPEMPVDKDGNWMDYPVYGHVGWETIHQPFYARMQVDGMRTGRSSKKIILKDVDTGKTYPMFVSDMVAAFQVGSFQISTDEDGAGIITAYWTGAKRGANYGIKPVKP